MYVGNDSVKPASGEVVIRAFGASCKCIEGLLLDARQMAGKQISCHHVRNYDEDIIKIVYGNAAPKMLVDDLIRIFVERLDACVYALENATLEECLVALLKVRGRKISVAESFTGGGIARRIVSVSGASEVYVEGLNTYSEISKIKRLGVSPKTLQTLGAVSEQTAYEMAVGLLNTGDCDVAVATTGLAGPGSDSFQNPVGLCYIAIGTRDRVRVYRYQFDGDRKDITEKAINYALYLTYRQLKDI